MTNPYAEEVVQRLRDAWGESAPLTLPRTWEEEHLFERQCYGELPKDVSRAAASVSVTGILWAWREELVAKYSWAVPTEAAVRTIAERGPIIEWCAGLGYWSFLAAQCGAEVEAYSTQPGTQACRSRGVFGVPEGDNRIWSDCWHAVAECEDTEESVAEAMATTDAECLLLVWPPYDEPVADWCLRHFRGRWVAYVGEWGGCTADEAFHDALENSWEERQSFTIPSWPGMRDNVFILERKE